MQYTSIKLKADVRSMMIILLLYCTYRASGFVSTGQALLGVETGFAAATGTRRGAATGNIASMRICAYACAHVRNKGRLRSWAFMFTGTRTLRCCWFQSSHELHLSL